MQDSKEINLEQKQSELQTKAVKGKKMPASGPRPPDCGQVPMAAPMEMRAKDETPTATAVTDPTGKQTLEVSVGLSPEVPTAQAYAPHIAAVSILLAILFGLVIFKMRADRRRLSKRCPHCQGRLERWADECRYCGKNIFVYPAA
jgi:hypothetical protein